jgi:hypothetical protein
VLASDLAPEPVTSHKKRKPLTPAGWGERFYFWIQERFECLFNRLLVHRQGSFRFPLQFRRLRGSLIFRILDISTIIIRNESP